MYSVSTRNTSCADSTIAWDSSHITTFLPVVDMDGDNSANTSFAVSFPESFAILNFLIQSIECLLSITS